MRFVRKEKLEDVLGQVPKQSISLFGYSFVYGQADKDLREAEERQRREDNSRGYYELCRIGAFCHPVTNFPRRSYH